MDMRRV